MLDPAILVLLVALFKKLAEKYLPQLPISE